MACFLVASLTPAAQAAQVIVTITGTVSSGSNGYFNGDGTIFRPNYLIAGEPFTLTYTFDDTKGQDIVDYSYPGGPPDKDDLTGSGASSPGSAVLQIGDVPYTFPTSTGSSSEATRWPGSVPDGGADFGVWIQDGINDSAVTALYYVKSAALSLNYSWKSPFADSSVTCCVYTFNISVKTANGYLSANGSLTPTSIVEVGPQTTCPPIRSLASGFGVSGNSAILPKRAFPPQPCACDANDSTTIKVLTFVALNQEDAELVAAETGLNAAFILAWAAWESNYGIGAEPYPVPILNNNFFGLKTSPNAPTSGWFGAVDCSSFSNPAAPSFACFPTGIFGNTLYVSALGALMAQNSKYLNAALTSQYDGGSIADIANAIATAGFNSMPGAPNYGEDVAAAANAIARRIDCSSQTHVQPQ
jgi:hypothetical protein